MAEVLKDYGYATAAWGKWHNTPAEETTPTGPFENWPTEPRLRIFLRLPRRRGLAIRAEPGAQHDLRPSAENPGGGLPPQRRPGGRRDRLAAQAQGLPAGQAVLHVLGERRDPRAPSRREGVGGQVQGQVRRRLGRLSRARFQARQGEGLDSRRRSTHPAARDDAVLGQHPRGREALPAPPDGSGGGLHRTRRCPGRPGRRRDRQARLWRQHADLLHLGRQRLLGGRPGRHDQRIAGAKRHSQRHRAAYRGARGTRRARRARLAQDRPHVPCGMGLGRQHALQGHEAPGLAFRRHAQPDGRPLAGEDQARCDPAAAVSPRQRRRPDDLRDRRHHPAAHGERRRAGPDRRRQFRLFFRRSEGQGPAAHPVFRNHGQPRHLSRRLDGLRLRAAASRGFRGCRPAFGNGRRTRTSGSFTISTRTGARPTTSPPRCRKSWRR